MSSVCSPNYLHDNHIRFELPNNSDMICEKPIVLNSWNIEALQEIKRKRVRVFILFCSYVFTLQ
ncbi:MAG: Gfo/Idh/MocA family oxidoreductase [Ginsengibacter sp.]